MIVKLSNKTVVTTSGVLWACSIYCSVCSLFITTDLLSFVRFVESQRIFFFFHNTADTVYHTRALNVMESVAKSLHKYLITHAAIQPVHARAAHSTYSLSVLALYGKFVM